MRISDRSSDVCSSDLPQARAAYERFGLNERQIELVARATPKRHYYLQSRRGNRLFELALGPVALALCGTSDSDTPKLIDEKFAEHRSEERRVGEECVSQCRSRWSP